MSNTPHVALAFVTPPTYEVEQCALVFQLESCNGGSLKRLGTAVQSIGRESANSARICKTQQGIPTDERADVWSRPSCIYTQIFSPKKTCENIGWRYINNRSNAKR